MMQPSESVTTPLGPMIVMGEDPARSPDSRTGGLTFSTKLSVLEISTCDFLRSGPSTRTPSMARMEGPTMVSCSLQAN